MSAPQAAGRVVVLNGTSSAGKTALAVALQRAAPELQLVHVQLDAFRAMEPPGYWSSDYVEQGALRVEALCRAINSAVAQFARFGQNVILDHVLTPTACRFLVEDLTGYEVIEHRGWPRVNWIRCMLPVATTLRSTRHSTRHRNWRAC